MNIKTLFLKKIADELKQFKKQITSKDSESIFNESYKIDTYVTLYEILNDQVDNLSETVLTALLSQSVGILSSLYEEWISKEGGAYEEIKDYVLKEVS